MVSNFSGANELKLWKKCRSRRSRDFLDDEIPDTAMRDKLGCCSGIPEGPLVKRFRLLLIAIRHASN